MKSSKNIHTGREQELIGPDHGGKGDLPHGRFLAEGCFPFGEGDIQEVDHARAELGCGIQSDHDLLCRQARGLTAALRGSPQTPEVYAPGLTGGREGGKLAARRFTVYAAACAGSLLNVALFML